MTRPMCEQATPNGLTRARLDETFNEPAKRITRARKAAQLEPESNSDTKGYKYSIIEEPNKQTANKQEESPLLRLPAEIRSYIYDLVLSGYELRISWAPKHRRAAKGFVVSQGHNDQGNRQTLKQMTALARICRQTHDDAALIFFRLSTFKVYFSNALSAFIDSLTEAQRSAIHTLRVSSYTIATLPELLESESFQGSVLHGSHASFGLECLEKLIVEERNIFG